jgi:hypothetical protein
VHGDDSRARARERQRVLEVRERRPDATEQPRQRPRHPQLPAPRLERDRLDAVGHQLRVPRDRGEAKSSCRGVREPSQHVRHMRLVAGALAPEHVRVDHDERRHASSR